MGSRILCSLLMLILLLTLAFSVLGGGNETDRQSLLAFKAKIINDPFGILSSWNESTHFCRWSGVTCGRRHQRVTMLDLHSQKLVGTLSPHIGNLSFLRYLNLNDNGFNQDIPQELGGLFRLQKLGLSNNSFGGEIPTNISRCANLIYLSISGNNLTGKLPAELGLLSKLQRVSFSVNNLIGEIPPSFGNLSSLQIIYLTVNNLLGSIPSTFGRLKKLEELALGANQLSGTIPPSIFNLSSITHFSTPVNHLHGSLPADLGLTLPNLMMLEIHTNKFTGLIPNTISNASNLSEFTISHNNFTGKLPNFASLHNLWVVGISENNLGNGESDSFNFQNFLSHLRNCTSLELLELSLNNFGGVLPEFISNFSTKLRLMALGGNQIRGTIPTGIGNLINLEALDMGVNQLTGTIPSSVGKLQKVHRLFFHENKLSGSIPSSLGNLTSLEGLLLTSNNLQGRIPSSLGECQNLLEMSLSQNNFSGTIPKEVLSISSLSVYLDISENHLTGSLPWEVGKLVHLGYLDVSRNNLSGEIPESLSSCTSLESLLMEGNFLEGTIPPSLNSLRGLKILDLSRNKLSGQIPKYLERFALQMSNLSYNNFEGEVPNNGVFKNTSAISINGNRKLCGGIRQLNLPTCPSNEPKKQRLSSKVKLIISLVSGLLGLTLMLSFLIHYWLRKTRKVPSSSSPLINSLMKVSYDNLLKATDGFSSTNLIGVGSFGSVYKGILPPDEIVVAIKVLNLQRKGASKSFMAECEALRNIRHRNLVKILTACSSVDFQGNDFKALVYEFMVNGSLEDWLHPIHRIDEVQEQRPLNLLQRINIAIDVSSALDYLHHHCQVPIVHCDLKPSNILMDNNMIAHVGDFGLARFRAEVNNRLSSNQTSSLGIKGSVGYAAPEYGMGSEVSTYGDLYSYGILLLEMFTRRRPTDDMFRDGLNLHNFVMMNLLEKVEEIADPILLQRNNSDETSTQTTHNRRQARNYTIRECLTSIFKIGVACSTESPRERMEISNVVAELHLIKTSLLGIWVNGQSNQ